MRSRKLDNQQYGRLECLVQNYYRANLRVAPGFFYRAGRETPAVVK